MKAKEVSEGMLNAASVALSESTGEQTERLLPTLAQLPATSRAIGITVAEAAIEEGLAQCKTTWKYRRIYLPTTLETALFTL